MLDYRRDGYETLRESFKVCIEAVMKCSNIKEWLPDVAIGIRPVPPEIQMHLRSCRGCAARLQELRSVTNLLDEWGAPEPSPFWDVRMQARLRSERQRESAGWLQGFRRPAISLATALSLVVGISFYQVGRFLHASDNPPVSRASIVAPAGTAVGDLEYLDKYSDLLQNFDALDYMDGDADANSAN